MPRDLLAPQTKTGQEITDEYKKSAIFLLYVIFGVLSNFFFAMALSIQLLRWVVTRALITVQRNYQHEVQEV